MEQPNPFIPPNETDVIGIPRTRFLLSPLLLFCIAYYGLAVYWGARSAVVWELSAGDFYLQVTLAIILGVWAVADARQRGKPIPTSAQAWFLFLASFVVPGYVIVTRGWKGLGWVTLHAVAWFTLFNLAMQLTGFLEFGDAWWQAMGWVE